MSKLEKGATNDRFVFDGRRGKLFCVNSKVRSGILTIGLCATVLRGKPTSCEEEAC